MGLLYYPLPACLAADLASRLASLALAFHQAGVAQSRRVLQDLACQAYPGAEAACLACLAQEDLEACHQHQGLVDQKAWHRMRWGRHQAYLQTMTPKNHHVSQQDATHTANAR